jgi:hypothetical protein
MGDGKFIYILVENYEGNRPLADQSIDGRIILKCI